MKAAADRAAAGPQPDVLPEFLRLAETDDALAGYAAGSAAVGILGWLGRWLEAAELAERVTARWADRGSELGRAGVTSPFMAALGAAEIYAGIPAAPRVARLAELTRADPTLQTVWGPAPARFAELGPAAGFLTYLALPTDTLLTGPATPTDPNWRQFSAAQQATLWSAAHAQNAGLVMIAMYDNGFAVPSRPNIEYTLAAALLQAGRADEAERLVLAARTHWEGTVLLANPSGFCSAGTVPVPAGDPGRPGDLPERWCPAVTALAELLEQSPGANGPPVEIDFGQPYLAWHELAHALSVRNGFTVFDAGVQLLRVGGEGWGWEMGPWNIHDVWKTTYQGLADDLFCFAQDVLGNQFAIDGQGQVVRFDAETGRRLRLGESLEEWAAWLLDDPDGHGTASLALAWQRSHRALEPKERLIPRLLLVAGGDLALTNLMAAESDRAMRIRGPIAKQVHELPPGTTVRLQAF